MASELPGFAARSPTTRSDPGATDSDGPTRVRGGTPALAVPESTIKPAIATQSPAAEPHRVRPSMKQRIGRAAVNPSWAQDGASAEPLPDADLLGATNAMAKI